MIEFKTKKGMKTSPVLILNVRDVSGGHHYVRGFNTETGQVLEELLCVSKKPLRFGEINYMNVCNDVLRCNEVDEFSTKQTPNQRIENILDAFDVVRQTYEKEKADLAEMALYKNFTVPFVQMMGAVTNILENDMPKHKENAFTKCLSNIRENMIDMFDQIHEEEERGKSVHKKLVFEKTEEFVRDMHKLDLIWDFVEKQPSLNDFKKLEEENLTLSELLSEKPKNQQKQEKKQDEKPEKLKKVEQKSLLDF